MIHPFLSSKRAVGYFILVWTIVMIAHTFVLSYNFILPMEIALADAIIFNLLFAIFSFPIWYIIRYVTPSKYKNTSILINHITSATLLILIWIFLSDYFLRLFILNDQHYLHFLDGSLSIRTPIGILLYLLTIAIYYIVQYYNDLQEKVVNESRLKELISQTELSLLKSQINPHFLFNSLNSISSLTIIEPLKAQEMVIKLSDYLRHTISNQTDRLVTLVSELEQIKRYLEIEEIRFSDKLELVWNIRNLNTEVLIPTMILQPIFENAIKHGLYDASNIITIDIEGHPGEKCYCLSISNNYEDKLVEKPSTKIGLKNIKERLRIIYESDSIIQITNREHQYVVKLHIPYST